ncbi:MAG: nucleotidyltransferase family protein [Magnetococcales bacterium]|nr:nucleotidyltransferase family protein [Magnetococcales bacterium]
MALTSSPRAAAVGDAAHPEAPPFPPSLALIFALLQPEPVPPSWPWSEVEPEDFIRAVRHHGVGTLFPESALERLPAPLAQPLGILRKRLTLQAMVRVGALREILVACESLGLPLFVLKGPALSQQLHGSPLVRPCRDLDLLVHAPHANAAREALRTLEFLPHGVYHGDPGGNHDLFRRERDGVFVELHWRPVRRDGGGALEQLLWSNAVTLNPGGLAVALPAPALEAAAPLLAFHGARHLWTRLVWLRDWDRLLRLAGVDWERTVENARSLRLERYLGLAAVLCRDHLATPLPPALTDPYSRLLAPGEGAAPLVRQVWRGPVFTDREVLHRVGRMRCLVWELGLRADWRGRRDALASWMDPSAADREAFPQLPWSWLPAARLWRFLRP